VLFWIITPRARRFRRPGLVQNWPVRLNRSWNWLGLAQQRYVKSHRNLFRSPRSGPHPGTPYRPIRVTGVGRPQGSFCFRDPISAESVRRSSLWTSGGSASDGGTDAVQRLRNAGLFAIALHNLLDSAWRSNSRAKATAAASSIFKQADKR
jgi:hypothetical protein